MFHEQPDQQPVKANELPPELAAFEQRLARVQPAAPRVDRDQLMFSAGHAAAQRTWTLRATCPHESLLLPIPSWSRSLIWPVATGMMTAATVALAIALAWQPRPERVLVRRDRPESTTTVVQAPADDLPVDAARTLATIRERRDPWHLADVHAAGFLTSRGMVLEHGSRVFAGDGRWSAPGSHEIDVTNHKSMSARELLEELLPASGQPFEASS